MFSRHLNVLLNHYVAAVLAHLERKIAHRLRAPSDPNFKGISIYRADPTGTIGMAASPHRQRRPGAARRTDGRGASSAVTGRVAVS